MNQRPLLLMLACFVFGEIGVYAKEQWIIIIGAAVLLSLLASFMYVNKSYLTLLLFVLCFIVGQIRCSQAMRPGILEKQNIDQLTVTATGQVDKIEHTASGYRVYLSRIEYTFLHNSKNVRCNTNRRIMFSEEECTLRLGQCVKVSGELSRLSPATNPGGFDSFLYYRGRNVEYQLWVEKLVVMNTQYWELLDYLRCLQEDLRKQIELLLDKSQTGVLTAILLGDKSQIDKDIKRLYQDAGIAHLIAISGLHIGFFGMLLFRLLRSLRFTYLTSALFSGGMLLAYGVMTGCSVSCERAIIMLLISFLGKVIGRAYDMLSSMSLAGLLLLFMEPLQLLDAGFLLSFGAIIGISAIYPMIKKSLNVFFPSCKCGRLADSFVLNTSVQLATFPIIAWFFYQLPVYQLFLNLLVLPMMSLLLPISVTAIVVSLFSLSLGKLFMLPAQWILQFFALAGGITKNLPGSLLVCGQPKLWQVFLYYGVLGAVLLLLHHKRYRLVLPVLSLLLFLILDSVSPALSITMLDVGQGDGLVIETPGGHVLLVDGGSTSRKGLYEYTYEPYLKSQGITKLDGVVITHSDEDHINGLQELIQKNYPIGALYLPRLKEPDENYLAFQSAAKEKRIPITYLAKGDVFSVDGISFTCLHPDANMSYENANSYSTTLSLSYGSFSMLFTGDLEGEGERAVSDALLKRHLTNYTILKVAHHGSKNSTSEEFLNIVSPAAAWISCGEDNRYGHPHKELLKRLTNEGVRVYDTPHSGALRVVVRDEIRVYEYLKETW